MKKYVLCDNKYFVSTNWLEQRLNDSRVRIIDASWYLPNVDRSGLKEFENKHIPGASFFDGEIFKSDLAAPKVGQDNEKIIKEMGL